MTHQDVACELREVEDELKKLATYRNDLEERLGKLLRDEAEPTTTPPVNIDPSPRDKFISDTKDMHLSESERALKAG